MRTDSMPSIKIREIWVDNVKVIACVLVVLGHFFQSMTKTNVLPENDLSRWFDQTIYYFHVPLFFICSGYLYQKFSVVDNFQSWKRNVIKKALNLGVPYITFSIVTWILKTVFSGSVNDEVGGLFDILFVHPASPYWYLYALFFIFLITPTFKDRKVAYMGLTVAFLLRLIGNSGGVRVQAVSYILLYEVWFVAGMFLCAVDFRFYGNKGKYLVAGVIEGILFLVLSVYVYQSGAAVGKVSVGMGMLGCSAVILLVISYCEGRNMQGSLVRILIQYTMPVFLMHTLFAAPLRLVLFKLGIQNAVIHMAAGLAISFAGPMAMALIAKKSKWMEFFISPGKFVKI